MIKGTTESGFQFELEEDVLDDYELWEDLIDVEEGRSTRIASVANRMLGKEQKKAMLDHLREENGRVPIRRVFRELGDIIRQARDAEKN